MLWPLIQGNSAHRRMQDVVEGVKFIALLYAMIPRILLLFYIDIMPEPCKEKIVLKLRDRLYRAKNAGNGYVEKAV